MTSPACSLGVCFWSHRPLQPRPPMAARAFRDTELGPRESRGRELPPGTCTVWGLPHQGRRKLRVSGSGGRRAEQLSSRWTQRHFLGEEVAGQGTRSITDSAVGLQTLTLVLQTATGVGGGGQDTVTSLSPEAEGSLGTLQSVRLSAAFLPLRCLWLCGCFQELL